MMAEASSPTTLTQFPSNMYCSLSKASVVLRLSCHYFLFAMKAAVFIMTVSISLSTAPSGTSIETTELDITVLIR